MTNWMSVAQSASSIAAKAGLLGWLIAAQRAYATALQWMRGHTTTAERQALRQLAVEAVHYVTVFFAHLPMEAKLEEAVRFVSKTADSLGLNAVDSDIRAVVAWAHQSSLQTQTQTTNPA